MQQLQSVGGVQRVVASLMNEIVRTTENEVFIISPNRGIQYSEKYFDIDKSIKIVPLENFECKKSILRRFVAKYIKKINSQTSIFSAKFFVPMIDSLYFPAKQMDLYKQFVIDNKIDVIVGANPLYSCLAAKISRATNIRCISWLHSTYTAYFEIKSTPFYGLHNLFGRYIEDFYKILVLTSKDKDDFEKKFNEKSKFEVFYNPTTLKANKISSLDANKLLFVGRLNNKTKGIDLLLEVAKKLYESKLNFTLDIVGSGSSEFMSWATNTIKRYGLERTVTLRGASNSVQDYYEKASLLLVTSRQEGFGLVITEAMAHGVPVLAFHAYGPDEIIENGKNGYLIDKYDTDAYAEKVLELLSNKEKLEAFSKAAINRAKDFEIQKSVIDFIDIISK